MLLIARTDSESAKLIASTADVGDHEYVLGTTTKGSKSLAQVLSEAEAEGASGPEIDRLEMEWTATHEMCTFNQGKNYHNYARLFA
jgi:isocitrate lyase